MRLYLCIEIVVVEQIGRKGCPQYQVLPVRVGLRD